MRIVENTIVEKLNEDGEAIELLRVLWIDPEKKNLVWVNIDNAHKKQYPEIVSYADVMEEIKLNRYRKVELEIDMRLLSPDEKYLEKYRENRDRRWKLIKDIVQQEPQIYIPEHRGRLIHEAYLGTGIKKKVIRDQLKKYWFYGKSVNGLIDNYFECGNEGKNKTYKTKPGPKTSNQYVVTERDKVIFESAVKVFHKRQKMSIFMTHKRMVETYYQRGYYRKYGVRVPNVDLDQSPTLRQFRYWYKKEYTPIQRYRNRHGKRKATMDVRPLVNTTDKVNCVGAMFEVDATRCDIKVVASDRVTILGKPTLYVVLDVFSLLVTGYHVSLASESWFEEMLAIEHAASDKVEYFKRFNIDINEEDWPCHYLPQRLVGDRGELKAQMSERYVNLRVDVDNAPSYRGDLKPYIESRFHITNKVIRDLLPGATEAGSLERGDRDPAKDAVMTIEELNRFLAVFFITYNKSALPPEYIPTQAMFEDKVELTPLGVWNWSKGNRLLREVTKDELRYNLFPRGSAHISRYGIEFKGLCYTAKLGVEEGWFDGNGNGINGLRDIEVTYDPRNCSRIFYKYKKKLEPFELTGRYFEFEGKCFSEIEKIFEYRDEQIKAQEKLESKHQAELHAFTKTLVEEASKETKKATYDISFYSRNHNKREAREKESKRWGAVNAISYVNDTLPISSGTETGNRNNIIPLSVEGQQEDMSTDSIQSLFSQKNRQRRERNETSE